MSETVKIYIPTITEANIRPPVTTINSGFVLEIFAEDSEKTLEPVWVFTNEIYCGEI